MTSPPEIPLLPGLSAAAWNEDRAPSVDPSRRRRLARRGQRGLYRLAVGASVLAWRIIATGIRLAFAGFCGIAGVAVFVLLAMAIGVELPTGFGAP